MSPDLGDGLAGVLEILMCVVTSPARPGGWPPAGEITLLLDHGVAAGLDLSPAYGWQHGAPAAWSTWWKGDLVIHVGAVDLIEGCPLVDGADVAGSAERLHRWHTLTGSAYHGTPGVAGTGLMKALTAAGRTRVAWTSPGAPSELWRGKELPFHPRQWKRAEPLAKIRGEADWEPGWLRPSQSQYDQNASVLAAAMCTSVAVGALHHERPDHYDGRQAGMWLVDLAPWHLHHVMPDPAGYPSGVGDGRTRSHVWLAGPTLALLDQLHDEGVFGGYRIREAWVSRASRIPLRAWAERIRDALTAGPLHADEPIGDVSAVRIALKRAYAETQGLMNRDTTVIRRPDWLNAIQATQRANLWRALWTIGGRDSRWPISIDYDGVWYQDAADPVALPLGRGLGQWKISNTRQASLATVTA